MWWGGSGREARLLAGSGAGRTGPVSGCRGGVWDNTPITETHKDRCLMQAMGKKSELAECLDKAGNTPVNRMRAVSIVPEDGFTVPVAARIMHVSDRTVQRWIRRHEDGGIEALRDAPGRGREPAVPFDEIRAVALTLEEESELVPRLMIEEVRRVAGYLYSACHMRRLHAMRMSPKRSVTIYGHAASSGEVKAWQERARSEIRRACRRGYRVVAQDESTFGKSGIDGRRLCSTKGEPVHVTRTGSKQNIVVYGAIVDDGKRLMRQNNLFNSESFVGYLKEVRRKWGKVLLLADNAPQHKARRVKECLEDHPEIRIMYLPVATPRLNVVEEWRHQAKYGLPVSRYYKRMEDLTRVISEYFRTCSLNLDLYNHLWHVVWGWHFL